jgi:hypothetical protein
MGQTSPLHEEIAIWSAIDVVQSANWLMSLRNIECHHAVLGCSLLLSAEYLLILHHLQDRFTHTISPSCVTQEGQSIHELDVSLESFSWKKSKHRAQKNKRATPPIG